MRQPQIRTHGEEDTRAGHPPRMQRRTREGGCLGPCGRLAHDRSTAGDVTMPVITNIEDLRVLHQRRAPRMFYDYCDSVPGRRAPTGERGGFPEDQAAPARRGEHRQPLAGDDDDRPRGGDADRAGAGRHDRNAERRRRDQGAARARERCGVPFTLSTMSILLDRGTWPSM